MWPFKKKFSSGGYCNKPEESVSQDQLRPMELEISEPIKTIADMIAKKDDRVFIKDHSNGYGYGYAFIIQSNEFHIMVRRIPSIICDSFFGSSTPEIGITEDEAKLLYDTCYERAISESLASEAENRAKLVDIYCKDSKGDTK